MMMCSYVYTIQVCELCFDVLHCVMFMLMLCCFLVNIPGAYVHVVWCSCNIHVSFSYSCSHQHVQMSCVLCYCYMMSKHVFMSILVLYDPYVYLLLYL